MKLSTFVLAAAVALPMGASKTLLAFGDSWAWLGYDQFRDGRLVITYRRQLTLTPDPNPDPRTVLQS